MWTIANIREPDYNRYLNGVPFAPNHVYVGRGGKGLRGSILANQATYKDAPSHHKLIRVDDPIGWFLDWLRNRVFECGRSPEREEIARLAAIEDGVLLCWCHPEPCHAAAIITVINEYRMERSNMQKSVTRIRGDSVPRFLRMKHIPEQFWCVGNTSLLTENKLMACIGARKVTPRGLQLFERMVDLAIEREYIVVSGFAAGSDIAATKRAIYHKKPSINVLAGGFQHLYPKEHSQYVDSVLEHGGLFISAHPPATTIESSYFMQRNHFIVNLASGVIVSEIGHHSGTFHATRAAINIGRPCGILASVGGYEAPFQNTEIAAKQSKAYPLYDTESVATFFNNVASFNHYLVRRVEEISRERQGDQSTLFG